MSSQHPTQTARDKREQICKKLDAEMSVVREHLLWQLEKDPSFFGEVTIEVTFREGQIKKVKHSISPVHPQDED